MQSVYLGEQLWPALWLALGTTLLGCFGAAHCVRRWLERRRRQRVARRAAIAEESAFTLLRQHGYEVLETQVEQLWEVHHGTENLAIRLRVDARVRRKGREFVAEIKSGALVSSLRHAPTRRQLLEYAVAYQASGVLLIDMQRLRIDEVAFPQLDARLSVSHLQARHYWTIILLAAILCALLVAASAVAVGAA